MRRAYDSLKRKSSQLKIGLFSITISFAAEFRPTSEHKDRTCRYALDCPWRLAHTTSHIGIESLESLEAVYSKPFRWSSKRQGSIGASSITHRALVALNLRKHVQMLLPIPLVQIVVVLGFNLNCQELV